MNTISSSENQYIKRINEIKGILKKNNFSYLIKDNDLILKSEKDSSEVYLTRIRKVFKDLGPSYIKFGQILATRPDLISVDIAREFEKLLLLLPPSPFDEILEIIELEFGYNPFESIDTNPIASVAIGQVHKGKLKVSGTEVAIKVQKPNIKNIFLNDIQLMKFVALNVENIIIADYSFNFSLIISELESNLFKEFDYIEEINNLGYLSNNFRKDSIIHIPKIYSEYCTENVIVMEFIEGEELFDVILSDKEKYDKTLIAQRLIKSFLKQVFIDGFYHSDPHSGNILIMDKNIVCFIDAALIGYLEDRKDLLQLLVILYKRDSENILNQLHYMKIINLNNITDSLIRDIIVLINRNVIIYNDLLFNLFKILIQHNIHIPKEFISMARGLSIIKRSCMELDSEFNMEKEVEKFYNQLS